MVRNTKKGKEAGRDEMIFNRGRPMKGDKLKFTCKNCKKHRYKKDKINGGIYCWNCNTKQK